jgi:hypothetical protein
MALDIIVVVLVYKIFTIVFKKEPDLDVIMSTNCAPMLFCSTMLLVYYLSADLVAIEAVLTNN